jgi:hypothetical protein
MGAPEKLEIEPTPGGVTVTGRPEERQLHTTNCFIFAVNSHVDYRGSNTRVPTRVASDPYARTARP